ncbi:hypothetical protein BB560_001331 [Smittium megazygosporum]|uniref:Amino acid transporter transmembrane domain-containing protein n=1 Tax=Smittium megazygosporum TaxID=133381 RepID=A0A2T9ZHV4_9FUNG|nr:hypothetical protein BB560_001331 [Smittium megazygosporum]
MKIRLSPDFEPPQTTTVNIIGFPVSFSSICFAFGGNLVYPDIELGMKTPKAFNKIMTISSATVTLLYLMVAASAYSVFGDGVVSPVLLSFTSSLVLTFAYIFITAHVILTAPLLLIGCSNTWEKGLLKSMGKENNESPVFRRAFRTFIISTVVVIVLYAPNFEKLVSFFSSLTSSLIIFILPVVTYKKLYSGRARFGFSEKFVQFFTLVVGFLCLIVGTYLSGHDLIYG